MIEITERDVLDWAADYDGPKFMALLCDPPYHLTSINNKSDTKGFMGKNWDGGDIAFVPDTWAAFLEHMLPGALGMAFASSRGWHRLAVAIEDAGFIIHPSIFGWVQGSGFPKASNPEKVLKKRGDDRAENFDGHRYGAQALKPSIEPIIVFQKPFGNVQIDNILRYGTGLYDIDRNRIGVDPGVDDMLRKTSRGKRQTETWEDGSGFKNENNELTGVRSDGRWPANFYLQHEPGCQMVGYRDENYQINRFVDGAKPWGDAVGEAFDSEGQKNHVAVWECVDGCPIRLMDAQSGMLKSGKFEDHHKITSEWGYHGGHRDEKPTSNTIGDSGGASRFFFQSHFELEQQDPVFYCAKAGKAEKDAGLSNEELVIDDGRNKSIDNPYQRGETKRSNPHPTVKPLALCKHLAGLLLPPQTYAPRRIMVPFAGSGSEMIGAYQAGWDEIIGIEKEHEYIEIATQRINYWTKQPKLF